LRILRAHLLQVIHANLFSPSLITHQLFRLTPTALFSLTHSKLLSCHVFHCDYLGDNPCIVVCIKNANLVLYGEHHLGQEPHKHRSSFA
jgi:hypothetical protein